MTPEERAEIDEWVSRLVAMPTRAWRGNDFFLIYTCIDPEGRARMMEWSPDTPESRIKVTRHYEAACCLGEFVQSVLPGEVYQRSDDEMALIRAVNANRDDDLPLLVYSDWLTEQGSSQGEFIRVKLEMSKLAKDDPVRSPLVQRFNTLAKDASDWIRPITDLGLRAADFLSPMCRFTEYPFSMLGSRGITEELTIDRPGLIPGAEDRIFAAAPFLRKLTFAPGHFRGPKSFALVKQLEQIEELDLSSQAIYPTDLAVLTSSKYLTGLRSLNLGGFGDENIRVLLGSSILPRLKSLGLHWSGVTSNGVGELVNSSAVNNLRNLDLSSNSLGLEGATVLANSPHLSQLEKLKVSDSDVGEEGKAALLERFGGSVVSFR